MFTTLPVWGRLVFVSQWKQLVQLLISLISRDIVVELPIQQAQNIFARVFTNRLMLEDTDFILFMCFYILLSSVAQMSHCKILKANRSWLTHYMQITLLSKGAYCAFLKRSAACCLTNRGVTCCAIRAVHGLTVCTVCVFPGCLQPTIHQVVLVTEGIVE